MLYTHTIGRIGKDCQVITGTHGTFMAVDIAVDDYSKGQNITTWVRVRSSRENHVRLAEYLTKGAMLTVEGYFKPEEWSDQEGVKHQRVLLVATKFYETPDKEEEAPAEEKKTSKKKAK